MNLIRKIWNTPTEVDVHLPLYIASIGGWKNQPEVLRKNGLPTFQWVQCVDGKGVLKLADKEITVSKGQGMLLFPSVPHHYYPVESPWSVQWVEFQGRLTKDILRTLHFHESTVLDIKQPDQLLGRIQEIYALFSAKRMPPSHDCSQAVYGLLLDLHRYSSQFECHESSDEYYEMIQPALSYIEQHYNRTITLQDLADQLGVSMPYTCVLFQQTLGTRPIEYLNRIRIQKAKELLSQAENLEVKSIAEMVGFDHPSYFIKIFKRSEGLTPTAFRKLCQ
ncbi:hypothetical protein GCM10023310_06970 [Paenibacillus vulneris]|uniref:AraC family transcriptional regulator n=1 Tax=Paenibacillus vulneris TaxID=1133364 RepID=A0ABW3UNJ8_9BACL|nr:AraC family transcriptional regulator [Paenibacillus sp. 32352]